MIYEPFLYMSAQVVMLTHMLRISAKPIAFVLIVDVQEHTQRPAMPQQFRSKNWIHVTHVKLALENT
ncbi:hypothetical protein A9K81_05715 [Pseudomonas syringae pv. syringae]|nr:hypothetical protein A9K81_05715 [Pseudomonas syringae pv. syringae]